MTIPADSDSFRSDDGRVEVVFDLEELSESTIRLVISAAVAALDAEHDGGPDRLTVMITGDERIRELNRVFKGEDEVTDVLSFNEAGDSVTGPGNAGDAGNAGDESGESGEAWPEPQITEENRGFDGADGIELGRLGDIAISLPQVDRQAVENGKSPERELAMLTVHGVLHLLGYDHAGPDEEKIMFGKTDAVLVGLFED